MKDPKYYCFHYYYREHPIIYVPLRLLTLGFVNNMAICYSFLAPVYIVILILISIPFKMTPITNYIFFISENSTDCYCDWSLVIIELVIIAAFVIIPIMLKDFLI